MCVCANHISQIFQDSLIVLINVFVTVKSCIIIFSLEKYEHFSRFALG